MSSNSNTEGFAEPEPVFTEWPTDIVRANFVFLVEKCDPKGLLDLMVQRHLLTVDETERVQKQLVDANTTTRDINRNLLLSVLPKKGAGAFDSFAFCLYFANENTLRDVVTGLRFLARDHELQTQFQKLLDKLRDIDTAKAPQEESSGPVSCTDDPMDGNC